MDDQTTLNGADPAVHGLRQNLSGLAHDTLTLAELQVQLLGVDLREARQGAGMAVGEMAVGFVLLLGCIPILMLAAAQALIEFLPWPASASYAVVAVVSAIVAVALLRLGWGGLFRSLKTIQRSRAELGETLRWLKTALKQGAPRASRSSVPETVGTCRF